MFKVTKVLVGSQAHGLATPESDYDYRGVFILPTEDLLSMDFDYRNKREVWDELPVVGDMGQTKKNYDCWYEIGYFLEQARFGIPNILEVFIGKDTLPRQSHPSMRELRRWEIERGLQDIYPYAYNPQSAYVSYLNYAKNNLKKMLDDKDGRANKYAITYLRTLHNLQQIMTFGRFTFKVFAEMIPILTNIRDGVKGEDWTVGGVVDLGETMTATIIYPEDEGEYDWQKVNKFLLSIRKAGWGIGTT